MPLSNRFESGPNSFQWGWPLSPVSWSGRLGGQSDWLIGLPASQAGCSAWWPAGLPVRPRAWLMSRPASSHAASQPASRPASVAASTPNIQEAGQHAISHMPIRWSCKPQLWQLEPRPESHQIEIPGTGFVVFWNQCQKVIKSNLLGLVLSTSGTKPGKLSNRPP